MTTNHMEPSAAVPCANPACIVKGIMAKCRLCENRVCIQHYQLVRDDNADGKVAAECWQCYGIHPDSNHERSVYL